MIIYGKNINLRSVREMDAKFIFSMRKDKRKTKHLSAIGGTVNSQREWIKDYIPRENKQKEFYFIIEAKNNEKLGLVRMYDFQGDSFCWGSWLIKDNAPKTTAIESALQIYEFGFNNLHFNQSHFDVRKDNIRVVAFHKRFGAKIVNKDQLDYFFNFSKKQYLIIKKKYARYL